MLVNWSHMCTVQFAQGEQVEDTSYAYEQAAPSVHSRDTVWSGNTVNLPPAPNPSYIPEAPESTSPPPPGEHIPSSHLRLFNFGSRFLPHTGSQIRCLLPVMGHRLLLIGHDEGLSVMNMVPDGEARSAEFADAQVRGIWEGEG